MLIFAIPKFTKSQYAAGNWKDVKAIEIVLSELSLPFKIVEFDDVNYESLLDSCTKEVTHLIMHYSWWPELLRTIKRKAPWIKLLVRTVNAEALQHFTRSEITLRPTYGNLRSIYGTLRLLWRDIKCRNVAHSLMGISDWDDKHYWKWLPGSATIDYMPYFSPWPYLRANVKPLPWHERAKSILAMPGGCDPIGRSIVAGFIALAQHFSGEDRNRDWKFLLSPGVIKGKIEHRLPAEVSSIERMDEPWDALCSVRAVAVLTPLGFGMKTSIVDGLAAGCHVLVHPALAKRLPEEIVQHCILCDPDQRNKITDIIKRLSEPPEDCRINERLKRQTRDVLLR